MAGVSARPTIAGGGGTFLAKTPERIFSPEAFVGDERLMIDTAEQFSRKEVLPVAERLDHQEEGLMPSLIRRAGELGFCGPDSPEAYGGLGLGKNVSARMLEFLSLNGSFSVTIGVTSGISQIGLVLFGNEAQRQKYLPKLASGEWIGAYALSEPNSGSDALAMTSRAVRKGDKWVLDGTKMWISNAKWAELFLVMAKVDGERVTAFLVERDSPGVSIAREEHKMGLKGSSTARLVLEGAEVPEENLLYVEGKGHHVAFNALNIGRFKLAAMSLGPARDAIGLAAGYALERRQFGRPIAEFGLIRRKFAEMAARFYAAESMLYRTGALIDEAFALSDHSAEGNRAAAEEYAIECSACKVVATEVEAFIVDEGLQVFGGYGFTEEFPIARSYRDARVSKIYEGTNEINRVFLADRLVRRSAEGRASLSAAGDSFVSDLAGRAFARFEPSERGLRDVDQIAVGSLSDLAMLAYLEQSSRLRAAQVGGLAPDLHRLALRWINAQAAQAYQWLTGEAVALPACEPSDVDALAEAVLRKRAPLDGDRAS
jgi:alkylation response protein AidB-like acyl-CoA dehydrogenase